MKKKISVLLALTAAALLPATSQAIVVTLDDANPTVSRLSSGYVDVAYTGTISVTDGFELMFFGSTSVWNASGDLIAGVFGQFAYDTPGTLFTVRYDASDFGLYAYDAFGGLASYNFAECQIGGGFCNNAGGSFSLNIVDPTSVPEPATITLFGAALLAGVGLRRRRPAAN
jgi:hypothetical protein